MNAVLKPIDHGIIRSFKAKYRTLVCEEKLEAIQFSSTITAINMTKYYFQN